MTRRRISAKERMQIFTRCGGVCHICGGKIDGGREPWDVEHIIPLAMGGEDEGENLAPAHQKCHRAKTVEDAAHIAKARRMRQRQAGIKRQPRQKIAGSRGTRWKRTIDGQTIRREE